MSTNSGTKINQLLQQLPQGTVLLSSWLVNQGYSRDLQHRYLKSGWLTSLGYGALKRTGDTINLKGALYCLQTQAEKHIHIGGRSALGLQGLSHYLELYQKETLLFAPSGTNLPLWFKKFEWETKAVLIHTSMLNPNIGLINYNEKTFTIKISDPTRAILECLELTPKRFDLQEAWQIMEGLSALNPKNVQKILEHCNSVKALRLFLFMAEKANHSWFKYLNIEHLNLGKGKRSIVPNGIYIPKYKITVPKEFS
ncbi:MAG: type IV toxin-antitoxin system AbiEi family antitoxin [Bacteroidales bacterium]